MSDMIFHSILVPVDYSPQSAEAIRYAAAIADRFAASLLVLHILPRDAETPVRSEKLRSSELVSRSGGVSKCLVNSGLVSEAIVAEAHNRAYEKLKAFLPPKLDQEQVALRIVRGRPCEEILFLARQECVDLIVMGTHGRTGLEYVSMGSIAEQVVRMAPCPVFTVKSSPSV